MSTSTHDPVCGAQVDPAAPHAEYTYAGTRYLFCSAECAREFERDPERYVSSIDGRKPTGRVPLAEAEKVVHSPRRGGGRDDAASG